MPPKRRRPPRPGALHDLPPLRIARSILLLQLSYYATVFLLVLFTTLVLGHRFELGLILDWRSVRADNTLGWIVGMCWVLTSFITVVPILILTTRLPSNLVPDFSLTIHVLHLVTTTVWTRSLPTNFSWWALQAGSAALMVLLGVWAVRYREVQRVVAFGKIGRDTAATGKEARGAHGGDGYEMVNQGSGASGRRADENV